MGFLLDFFNVTCSIGRNLLWRISSMGRTLLSRAIYLNEIYCTLGPGERIRLLELQHDELSDALKGTLTPFELDNAPTYEAISYCWGDGRDRTTMELNGHTFPITRNLKDALEQVRGKTKTRYVWADGICINQSDLQEREHQVTLMHRIYAQAERVMICVGRDDKGKISVVFDHIRHVVTYFEPYTESWEHLRDAPHPEPNNPMCDGSKWALTLAFLLRPWFSRVWVLQEVALSKDSTVYCGDQTISWVDVLKFRLTVSSKWDVQCIMDGFFYPKNLLGGRMMDAFNLLWCTYGNDSSKRNADLWNRYCQPASHRDFSNTAFLDILIVASRFEATDPRDYIYAFLGHPSAYIADQNLVSSAITEADYSISLEELYSTVAARIIEGQKDLRILSTVRHTKDTFANKKIRSWIPQWHATPGTMIIAPLSWEARYYNASLLPETVLDYVAEISQSRCLRVRSLHVGSIKGHGSTLDPAAITLKSQPNDEGVKEKWINPIEDAWEIMIRAQEKGATYYTDEWLAFLMTLATGLLVDSSCASNHTNDLQADFQAFCRKFCSNDYNLKVFGDKPKAGTTKKVDQDASATRFALTLERNWVKRKFFVTQEGLFGIGPGILEAGDVVCVLIGGRVPFVLRPTPKSSCYELVGECYLHGFMEGEAIHMWRQGNLEAEIVELI